MQASRHDGVHQVIDARDAIEHRAHLRGLQRPAACRATSEVAAGIRLRRSVRCAPRPASRGRYFSCSRKVTTAWNFFGGRFLNDGIGAVGLTSVRAIAWRGIRPPTCVSTGPGPLLPLSPSLWHARHPDAATTLRPVSNSASVAPPACEHGLGRGYFVGERRPGVGAGVGQERHRADHEQGRHGRYRPVLGATLGAAVIERQQEQQDHAQRRDPDRRQPPRGSAA